MTLKTPSIPTLSNLHEGLHLGLYTGLAALRVPALWESWPSQGNAGVLTLLVTAVERAGTLTNPATTQGQNQGNVLT